MNELARSAAARQKREQLQRVNALRIAMADEETYKDAIQELTA